MPPYSSESETICWNHSLGFGHWTVCSIPHPALLPAIEEEKLPPAILLAVDEAALEPVCGGVGDGAEAMRETIIIKLPWRGERERSVYPCPTDSTLGFTPSGQERLPC